MEAALPHAPAPPVLSERLAALDLAAVDEAELAALVAAETRRLVVAERAIVWSYRPTLRRLFVEQAGEDVRAVEVSAAEAHDVLAKPALWAPEAVGIRRSLMDASFGVATGGRRAPILAVPLDAASGPAGLLLVRLRRAADAGRVLAAIDPLARQAGALLANREALARARSNEAQLEALYQTAGEISARLELETVLSAIVERARLLAGTPIAYIMLVDDDADEISMRVHTGIRSPSFLDIRLELGAGLGGTVAQEQQPFYTGDYLNDARFTHLESVDAEVRGEGVKSILGVPMTAGDKLVGVLYAADRRVRSFADAEVDVLMSLAHHAALAIENAALYERATRTLADLERANELLERGEQVHRQLSEIVLAGAGLRAVVDLMAELVGESAVVLDERGRPLAAAGKPADAFGRRLATRGKEGARDDDLRAALARVAAFAPAVVPARPPARARPRLVVPIVARAELLGSVWVETTPEALDDERPLIEQATRVLALELLKEREVADAERRLRRELLDELLSPRPAPDGSLERRAAQLGVDLREPHRLAVGPAGELAAALRDEPDCLLSGEHGGRSVALVRADSVGRLRELARRLRAPIAVSPPLAAGYRAQLADCERALELLGGAPADVIDLDETRVLTLLFREGGEEELRRFARDLLGPLLGKPDLLTTLEAYLATGGSATRTAATLHVHVNTVYYRVGRLRALLGDGFANPRRALDLQVALLARRLVLEEASKTSA